MSVRIPDVYGVLSGAPALTAIVGKRIYRTQADENAAAPYVVWSIVSAVPEINLSELPETDNARIQIDCYSSSQQQCRQMMLAAMDAIEAVTDVVFGPAETKEDDTKLWRWVFDASFWESR